MLVTKAKIQGEKNEEANKEEESKTNEAAEEASSDDFINLYADKNRVIHDHAVKSKHLFNIWAT